MLRLKNFPYQMALLLLVLSCHSQTAPPPDMEAISEPVQYDWERKSVAVLDKDGGVWQWRFDDEGEVTELTKVTVPKAVGIQFNWHHQAGWAVTKKGELYIWPYDFPELGAKMEVEKPVKKIITKGDLVIQLFQDGTLWSNGFESRMGFNAPDSHNDQIAFDAFPLLRDIYWKDTYLIGLTEIGDVYAACGSGLNSLLIKQPPTEDGQPLQIKGLSFIKRFKQNSRLYFAFGRGNQIWYWNHSLGKNSPEMLDAKGNNIMAGRAISPDGFHTATSLMNKRNNDEKLRHLHGEKMDIREGYGMWHLVYPIDKTMVLDREGLLWIYDFNRNAPAGTRLTNPKRIGNFKVKLDYYRY